MDWFRSHHGAPTDPKWRVVAKRVGIRPGDVAAIWWALMDFASQREERGSTEGFDSEVLAEAYGYPVEHVRETYETLRNMGLVSECFMLVSWERRQPKSAGTSTDRVRRHRAKKKGENVSETGETISETTKRPRSEQNRDKKAPDFSASLLKTKRRLTDEERALAGKALGSVPAEGSDDDVAYWRRIVGLKDARKAPEPPKLAVVTTEGLSEKPKEPAASSPEKPAEEISPVTTPASPSSAEDWPEMPEKLKRSTA